MKESGSDIVGSDRVDWKHFDIHMVLSACDPLCEAKIKDNYAPIR